MKEKPSVPSSVVLLRKIVKPDGIYFEDLPLSAVPESELENIKRWMGFVQGQVKMGYIPASYGSKYLNDGQGEVAYKIIAAENPLNQTRFIPLIDQSGQKK